MLSAVSSMLAYNNIAKYFWILFSTNKMNKTLYEYSSVLYKYFLKLSSPIFIKFIHIHYFSHMFLYEKQVQFLLLYLESSVSN